MPGTKAESAKSGRCQAPAGELTRSRCKGGGGGRTRSGPGSRSRKFGSGGGRGREGRARDLYGGVEVAACGMTRGEHVERIGGTRAAALRFLREREASAGRRLGFGMSRE